ncbi:MAG: NAD(+)/NADH kinase [Chloroflexi bacterium]|nr:NAD(+)/NADH kinase [Chloroflexota bacterium]
MSIALFVGLIANPNAGHDIRRVVSHASIFNNQEKIYIIRRVLMGLAAAGVERVAYLPEPVGLVPMALDGLRGGPAVEPLDMRIWARTADSTDAGRRFAEMGARCIVVLGGDGTNRAVAKGCGDVPIVPISTGTNNVFPTLVEGTVAGLAAGVVASERLNGSAVVRRSKRLEVFVDGEPREIALVDAAVSRELFTGARAIWDPGLLGELLLTRAEPGAVGLCAIGGQLDPIGMDEPAGLFLRIGEGPCQVTAAMAPGMIRPISIAEHRRLAFGDGLTFEGRLGTIALDGEREVEVRPHHRVEIRLSAEGPYVVDIPAAMGAAARAGLFRATC